MGAVFRWIKYIYEWCRDFAFKLSGSGFAYRSPYDQGVQFYVDGLDGLDTNDGSSWAKAFKTIKVACAAANALVGARGWVVGEYSTIWIRPGRYDEHDIPFPLFCHVIGLGIHGTDTQTEIRPTPGAGVTCIFGPNTENAQATHLANLWMVLPVDNAAIIDARELNSSLIEDCVFRPDTGKTGVIGIRTAAAAGGASRPEIRRCSFESGDLDLGHAMYFQGTFLQNARIHDNDIFAEVGIYIAGVCTAAQAVIQHNRIIASVGIGIDDNNGGSYVIDNDITAPTDGIEHAGGRAHTIRNRVEQGGAVAWESA